MSALSDDRPQFERLDGDARAAAAKEYRRAWGEEMPAPAVTEQDHNDAPQRLS